MAQHSWTIFDAASDDRTLTDQIGSDDLSGTPKGWRVTRRRLHGGLADGVDVVELDTGRAQYVLLPTRGMGLWQARFDELVLGWRSPIRGPVHPKFVPLGENSGLGWLDGFDELVVRCGLESNGAPDFDDRGHLKHGLHGRIANRPAHHVELVVDDSAGTITVRGVVDECRFHFQKLRLITSYTTNFLSTSISWHDTVENIGGTTADLQLLYHINVGEPFLDTGTKILAPVDAVCPRDGDAVLAGPVTWHTFPSARAGSAEQAFYLNLRGDAEGHTSVLLQNSLTTCGVGLRFNRLELPWFCFWRNTPAPADGYVAGLEPATNLPNPKSFEEQHGRVVKLVPGDTWQATLTLDWLANPESLAKAARAVAELQGAVAPVVHGLPLADWTPAG